MLAKQQNLTLYHASFMAIEKVDLRLCGKRNDFGQGFYLTTSLAQAKRFIRTAVGKSGRVQNSGFVNEYLYEGFDGLECLEFLTTDKDWLHCVCEHRRRHKDTSAELLWDTYDVMIGKIADDDTMTVVNAYLGGIFGQYGSDEAFRAAVAAFKPDRLDDQICLKTQAAADRLRFVGSEEVPI
jgi:hypothetical protein